MIRLFQLILRNAGASFLLSLMGWLVLCVCCGSGIAIAATPREKLDVVVLLDSSGSMLKDGGQPGNDVHFTRLAAVQYLLEKMAPGDRIALVTFDSTVHTDPDASRLQDVAATGMPGTFYAGVRRIAAAPNASTNMADGLRRAGGILQQSGGRKHRRFLILLTDGTPNPQIGENTPSRLAAYAAELKREGISLHTVGLGNLSSIPSEAEVARKLLVRMALQGGGAPHQAHSAEDLPALFGSIFAQLVGHEVSRPVAPGAQTQFTIAPGTHNLRVVATNDGAPPGLELTDPTGKPYLSTPIAPLLPGRQTALLAAASVDDPPPGTWTVRAVRGALEVAWEPNFEAVLRAPIVGKPVPSQAPIHLIVDVRQRGSSALVSLSGGRVEAEYRTGIDTATIPLTAGPSGDFEGDLPDSGPAGAHDLVVRCFRQGDSGEEEGGPARATLSVEDLPVLSLDAPGGGAYDTLGMPIPITAHVRVAGRPLPSGAGGGLQVSAQIQDGPNLSRSALQPTAGGEYSGSVIPAAPAGPSLLSCMLTGRYEGEPLTPQTVTVPLTVTPRPVVQIVWPTSSLLTVGRDGNIALDPRIRTSAGAATSLAFVIDGLPHAALSPGSLVVGSGQVEHVAPLRLLCRGLPPGRYAVTITTHAVAPGIDIVGDHWQSVIYMPTWLERNRWWLYPLLGLSALLILLITVGMTLWAREQTRRRRKMLNLLGGAAVYVPHTTLAYRPPPQAALVRRSYTFGGPGADVFIPDPERPGQPLFAEPRLRVGVAWRAGEARLLVTMEGAQTQWFDLDRKLLAPPLSPTEGGVTFRVEPEHVLVRVNSEWTY